jgi:hypothetical protein
MAAGAASSAGAIEGLPPEDLIQSAATIANRLHCRKLPLRQRSVRRRLNMCLDKNLAYERRDGCLLPALGNVRSLAILNRGLHSAINVGAPMLKGEIATEPTADV